MLSALDETLMHQGPLPFSLAMVIDHRFYDRYVVSGFRSDGQAGIVTGMSVYKNLKTRLRTSKSDQRSELSMRSMTNRLCEPHRQCSIATSGGEIRTDFAWVRASKPALP